MLRFDPSFTTHRKEAALLTEKELMLIDIYRSTLDQAHESIGLIQDSDKAEYHIEDALAEPPFRVLWRGPVPKNSYDQRKAWADAQQRLGEFRDLRTIKAVIGLHEQQKLGKI